MTENAASSQSSFDALGSTTNFLTRHTCRSLCIHHSINWSYLTKFNCCVHLLSFCLPHLICVSCFLSLSFLLSRFSRSRLINDFLGFDFCQFRKRFFIGFRYRNLNRLTFYCFEDVCRNMQIVCYIMKQISCRTSNSNHTEYKTIDANDFQFVPRIFINFHFTHA